MLIFQTVSSKEFLKKQENGFDSYVLMPYFCADLLLFDGYRSILQRKKKNLARILQESKFFFLAGEGGLKWSPKGKNQCKAT